MNIILSHLSFPISGTDLKDKKVVPKWYMGPKGDTKRVYLTQDFGRIPKSGPTLAVVMA